jgi:CO/xanthine dehydrogenase Mo-binding subunit
MVGMRVGAEIETSYIGQRVPRVEDREFVTGAARYVADLRIEGCLEAVFVRSPVAHGTLRGTALEGARAVPGVVGVYAAPDLPSLPLTPAPLAPATPPEMRRPALATARSRATTTATGSPAPRRRERRPRRSRGVRHDGA